MLFAVRRPPSAVRRPPSAVLLGLTLALALLTPRSADASRLHSNNEVYYLDSPGPAAPGGRTLGWDALGRLRHVGGSANSILDGVHEKRIDGSLLFHVLPPWIERLTACVDTCRCLATG